MIENIKKSNVKAKTSTLLSPIMEEAQLSTSEEVFNNGVRDTIKKFNEMSQTSALLSPITEDSHLSTEGQEYINKTKELRVKSYLASREFLSVIPTWNFTLTSTSDEVGNHEFKDTNEKSKKISQSSSSFNAKIGDDYLSESDEECINKMIEMKIKSQSAAKAFKSMIPNWQFLNMPKLQESSVNERNEINKTKNEMPQQSALSSPIMEFARLPTSDQARKDTTHHLNDESKEISLASISQNYSAMEVAHLPQSDPVNVKTMETYNKESNQLSQTPTPTSGNLNKEVSTISATESSSNECAEESNPGIALASPKRTRSLVNPTFPYGLEPGPVHSAIHRFFQARNLNNENEKLREVPKKRQSVLETISCLKKKTFNAASQIKSDAITYAKTK
ncbi:hypothetical protein HMI56_005092, partial [Coelomomyces lativittatus]